MKIPHVYCFAPIENSSSNILILGSMPGEASLKARQYYAHPRNLFWRILGDLIGASAQLPYESRLQVLNSNGIALWDVLNSCIREGSLDSDIDDSSITPNDFASFYRAHPRISHVFFNGSKAEEIYRKRVLSSLGDEFNALQYKRLPSTSPAHASLSYEQKLSVWKAMVQPRNGD
jgi:TDG/mug DNA glycosylase family protein